MRDGSALAGDDVLDQQLRLHLRDGGAVHGRGRIFLHPGGEIADAEALDACAGVEVQVAGDAGKIAGVGPGDGLEHEQCIFDGINVNITLLFSVKVYEEVARAYLRGLQRRMKDGKPVDVASVASFFVSRVDTAVDKLLEQKIAAAKDPAERERLQRLLGKAAIANAKMAYQSFLRIFNEPEFAGLRRDGASVQRCLVPPTLTE